QRDNGDAADGEHDDARSVPAWRWRRSRVLRRVGAVLPVRPLALEVVGVVHGRAVPSSQLGGWRLVPGVLTAQREGSTVADVSSGTWIAAEGDGRLLFCFFLLLCRMRWSRNVFGSLRAGPVRLRQAHTRKNAGAGVRPGVCGRPSELAFDLSGDELLHCFVRF